MLLAETFLERFGTEEGKPTLQFSKEAVMALKNYAWPGNVRELENRVKRAVVMCATRRLTAKDLGLLPSATDSEPLNLKSARDQLDREMLTKAMKRHAGRISLVAAELGISRPTCYEMIEKLGVPRAPDSEPGSAESSQ